MNSVLSSQPEAAALSGVTKNYGSQRALDGIDLSVRSGELLALLGPNGAGKTTAVKLMLGLLKPDAGMVRVFGQDPRTAEHRQRTGVMLQVARVPETLRVREHIDLFSSYYPHPLPMAEMTNAAGLRVIENRFFGELSGGQKQRVLFALAICGDPDLLFLDEPTVGLDVQARRALWAQIRALLSRGKSILLTTHYLEADALANRIAVLHNGQVIASGTPAEIKRDTSLEEATLVVGAIPFAACESRVAYYCVLGIPVLGFANYPFDLGASCFFIYAAAMFGHTFQPRVALGALGLLTLGIAAQGWFLHTTPWPWVFAVVFSVALGVMNIHEAQQKQANAKLRLSEGTVRNYLSEAISKLGAANRVEAARIARSRGWL